MSIREHDQQYLLRVWKDGKGEDAWRMSLKALGSQEILYFADKEKLFKRLIPLVLSEDNDPKIESGFLNEGRTELGGDV